MHLIEREWFDRFAVIVCHFALGPLVGVYQQIEPDRQPNKKAAGLILVNLAMLFYVAPLELRLAILWCFVNPSLLYVFSTIPETVYEHRGYTALLGIAMAAAWAAERAPIMVGVLGVLYTIRTIDRNFRMRTSLSYWRLALVESPYNWRCRFNYAQQLQVNDRELEALPLLLTLFDAPNPCGVTAAQHATAIYLKFERFEDAEKLVGRRGSAILKFPNNPALRVLRSNMLRQQGHEDESELALKIGRALVV